MDTDKHGSKAGRKIIVRKVRLLAPIVGEIEVSVDITDMIDDLAIHAAKHALKMRSGHSKATTYACAKATATVSPETMITATVR